MSFSNAFIGQKPVQSPDGTMVAAVDKYSVVVRDADTLELIAKMSCLDAISQLLWSPDSAFVLCAEHKRAIVQVFSLHDPEWSCRIDEGVAGLTHASWIDSRHIITTSEFQVHYPECLLYPCLEPPFTYLLLFSSCNPPLLC